MSTLEAEYAWRHNNVLLPVAGSLHGLLNQYLSGQPRVDRISVRAKSIPRFLAKASKQEDGEQKYSAPLEQIQDQIGARIITFYITDLDLISAVILKYFRPIEIKAIVPDSEKEFGYVGKHFILVLPEDVFPDGIDKRQVPLFFELQVKTLFQHAWSEAEHDLNYKAAVPLTLDQKRSIAFTAAQAWGADKIFGELVAQIGSRDCN
ncbi:MAG: RelA/SpoT domain-containing protein [Rhodoferax sp.]|nr:RelA/SpoT domain-containing protein [Rhodoferax sp.]